MSETERKSQKGIAKPRSPAYPGISLEEAITRARQVYTHERGNKAHVPAIYSHWNYGIKSGKARVTLAALKYYGLIKLEGSGDSRQGRLTSLALDILLDDREGSDDRVEAIKKAALSPAIHSELWNNYQGNFPSDESLKFSLQREMGFTERGVKEFLEQFNSTLAYAKLSSSEDMPQVEEDKLSEEEQTKLHTNQIPLEGKTPPPLPPGGTRNIQLPLSSNSWATLSAKFPLSKVGWDQMIAVLTAMKPALVEDKEETEESEDD